ncbi:hypothetical protein [Pseudonocardia xishanensis]|uniref:Glycosyltransferase family 39 protein n=1 Tax=Pseudonocardia xishanensis TaxID=630995 RepID=A0ABP8RPP6_9PSEU
MIVTLPSRAAVGSALLPTGLYLGVRAVGLAVLAMVATARGTTLPAELGSWDGQWFLALATGGYDGVPADLVDAFGHRSAETPLAFFPGYPGAVALVRLLTGLAPLPGALLTTLLAGVVAAHGLARLGELVPGGSRRAGLVLVVLVAAMPMGVVFSMAYSEALFCACTVWALVAVLRENWLLAGVLTALAGVVRPTAAALVVAVVGAAVLHGSRRAWGGALLACAGLAGYVGFVALRSGSPTGWFALQARGWGSAFDGGRATLGYAADALGRAPSIMGVTTVAVLLGALALLVVAVREAVRGLLPWPLVVFAAGVLVMDLGSDGLMSSKARLLVPAVTLLAVPALALARLRVETRVSVLVAAVSASAWFGGYALAVWPYAI